MFVPIVFGIAASIIIYTIIRALLADYEGFNMYLNFTHAIILCLISGITLIFKSRVIEAFWKNEVFWNTFIMSNFGIALLIVFYIFFKRKSTKK